MAKEKRNAPGLPKGSRYGRFYVDPDLSGYENAVGECGTCGATLTVNRATDLDNTYPSSGQQFRCVRCGKLLRVGGDIANGPVDQIAYDALIPLVRREYMQATLMVAQALEFALAMCIYRVVLGAVPRPKRPRRESPFAMVSAKLEKEMANLTLGQSRAVLAGLGAEQVVPKTVAEAETLITRLRSFTGADPKPGVVEAIADPRIRDVVRQLIAARSFVRLRNNIAHHGLRPTQSVAEHCYRTIPPLATECLRGFGVVVGQIVMPPVAGGRRRAR